MPTFHNAKLTPADVFPRPASRLVIASHEKGIRSSNHQLEDEETLLGCETKPGTSLSGDEQIVRRVDRGAPGDAALAAMVQRGPEERDLARQRNKFYGEIFAYREANSSAKERAGRESVITGELKTNVIVKDEYALITDLSEHIAQRYQRPMSSILITLDHSACLLFGGSFDPAYIFTISALPSQVQPTINKRNATLIQSFLLEFLNVPPSRGVLRFMAIPEENLATNGMTVFGMIECSNKSVREQESENREAKGRHRSRSRRHRDETMKEHKEAASRPRSVSRYSEREKEKRSITTPLPAIPITKSALDVKAEKAQKMSRRKSLMSIFGK